MLVGGDFPTLAGYLWSTERIALRTAWPANLQRQLLAAAGWRKLARRMQHVVEREVRLRLLSAGGCFSATRSLEHSCVKLSTI